LTFVSAPAAGVIIQARHIGFAGASSQSVTGFYGRTGNVQLKNTDNVAVNNLTVAGNLDVTGDLTYDETVSRNLNVTGVATVASGIVSTGDFKIGTATTLSQDNIFTTGIITATSFVGSGANLTGVASTENIRTNTNATFLQNVTVVGTSTVTGNIVPSSDSATDIGTNSVRFQNAYVDTYYGDGSNLTGIGGTDFIHSEQINNSGVTTTGKLRIDVNSTSGTGSGNVEAIFLRNTNETDGNAVAIFGGADDYSNAGSAINFVNVDHSANVGQIQFDTRNGSNSYAGRIQITSDGHLRPVADNAYDIGSSSLRFRNIYTADLHCSNKGSSNDVDGTWGDYTIQEGESDLFLINNRSGKKYKFNLTEVS